MKAAVDPSAVPIGPVEPPFAVRHLRALERVEPAEPNAPRAGAASAAARRSWPAVSVPTLAAAAVLVFFVLCSVAPWLFARSLPTDMRTDLVLSPPSFGHFFGTDQFGRDVFALVVYGARPSLVIGVSAVAVGSAIGVALGVTAGYVGGAVDAALMRLVDVWMAVPAILLAIALSAALGPSLAATVVAVSVASAPRYARVLRGHTLSLRKSAFVDAARASGSSHASIVRRHVLPHCAAPILVMATLGVGGSVLVGAALSFIGLGVNDERPDWGYLLTQGRGYLTVAWWTVTYPGLALTALVVSINVLGEALRRRMDPRDGVGAPSSPRAVSSGAVASRAPLRSFARPPLLEVDDLAVCFDRGGRLGAVDRATFHVERGETVCLVGESGCGKTVTALSLLRLEGLRGGRIAAGDIVFDGKSLVRASDRELDGLRGSRIAMIFQEPMTAFDPLFSIGDQIIEAIRRHERGPSTTARARALRLLERVHIPDPELRMRQVPEELSGGMRQRAMIAMALACGPDLLVADEPTTALDVTTQAQILALLKELQEQDGMAILLITHDVAVASAMADRVVVMYAGRIVEQASAEAIFSRPRHPYTRALLRASARASHSRSGRLDAIPGAMPRLHEMPSGCRFHPRCERATSRCKESAPRFETGSDRHALACWNAVDEPIEPRVSLSVIPAVALLAPNLEESTPLVEAVSLRKVYEGRRGLGGSRVRVHALDGVSLTVRSGETLGLVGESGCGKSTLGRVLLGLESPNGGSVRYRGRPIEALRGRARRRLAGEMQMIFQDPYGSIDPRWTVHDVVAEPLVAQAPWDAATLRERVEEVLDWVGLPKTARTSYVHEFSGGQRQRIGIARAIAPRPRFIVADEAVSALDLSVRAQIVNLLADLRDKLGLTSLFIAHGLDVVRHISDRIGVMYLGRVVETGPAGEVFARPAHPYSQALLGSAPAVDGRRRLPLAVPVGEVPSAAKPPPGCHFHPRCPSASDRCRIEAPVLQSIDARRAVACHHPRA
jgi:peptide/nickel transport system ATP-binding protein